MPYVIPPSPVVGLPVDGTDALFPVRRVYCVGRNYAAHVREMGFDPSREPPFFFCKPNDDASVVPVPAGTVATLPYPPQTGDYHYEAELVVAIGQGGRDIAVEQAAQHIYGYAAGLDMTRRDLQIAARDKGRPWETGKAFDYSAPIGPLRRRADVGALDGASLVLEVDGQVRQQSTTAHLIWSVEEIISRLSALFALEAGDLVFTGTPEGVGAVSPGQTLALRIDGLAPLAARIA
ncbi:fumarylacetoacetate hydrolase family protein [Variovorax sp. JS1663]|uniref:fumarylacetoacetate hydrolase family protein n=1 Tax=Variovorax sp. JS1663 TaxID=1851577 RepID=UPI000B3480C5|nr:fumarylacetoacetate hydrolase family protein [Variovorax sp. JS1663]OUL97976.1 fumarylacetoacetate hydrolase [Variovorax sp. JS1663]